MNKCISIIFGQHPVTACVGAHSDTDWNGMLIQQHYHSIMFQLSNEGMKHYTLCSEFLVTVCTIRDQMKVRLQ